MLYITLNLQPSDFSFLKKDTINDFNSESLFISAFYSSFLKNVKVKKIGRFTIELISDIQEIYIGKPSYQVCVVNQYFNIQYFLNEKDQIKRFRFLLDLLQETLLQILKKFNLDSLPFENAYKNVMRYDFKYQYIVYQDKSFRGNETLELTAVYKVKKIDVELNILDGSHSNILAIQLIELFPNVNYPFELFSKVKRIDNDNIEIIDKSGEIVFCINLKEKKVNVEYRPSARQLEELIDEMKIKDYNTPINEIEDIYNKLNGLF